MGCEKTRAWAEAAAFSLGIATDYADAGNDVLAKDWLETARTEAIVGICVTLQEMTSELEGWLSQVCVELEALRDVEQ